MNEDIAGFIEELQRQEASPKTVANYQSDLLCFARWFEGSTVEAFAAPAVTPTDIRDYKSHLLNVENRKPATVNRRLAALRKFFQWAKAEGRVQDVPTEATRGVKSEGTAPKWLDKREVDRLIRAAQKEGKKRDIAILEVLRHTGIRVGELSALRQSDIEISERRGTLTVRSGKGSKYRQIPLNNDARKALSAYLEVRPKVSDDHLFVGQRGTPKGRSGRFCVLADSSPGDELADGMAVKTQEPRVSTGLSFFRTSAHEPSGLYSVVVASLTEHSTS